MLSLIRKYVPLVLQGRFLFNRILILATVFLVPSFTDLHAQAWTMPRGEHFVKLAGGYIIAADQYTFDGRIVDFVNGKSGNAFTDQSLYLYTELGLFQNLTMVVSIPYKRIFIEDLAYRYRTFAMGSGTLGLRIGLMPLFGVRPSAVSMALNLAVTAPMGYSRNYAPSAGPGQLDAQAVLGIGLSFYPTAAYLQASGGYRYRSSVYALSRAQSCNVGADIDCVRDLKPDYGDELVFSAEGGIQFFNGFLFIQALANGVWSVDAPYIGFTAINPIPTLQRYIKAGGGIAIYPFRITHFYGVANMGLSAQYFFTPYGRNTIQSRDLFVGIEYRVHF
jgi:hypothetical protein